MRIFVVAMMIAVLTAPAYAQKKTDEKSEAAELEKRQKERQQQIDENAYKAALERLPAKQPDADPWGNIRGAGSPPNKQNKSLPGSK
jgi:hypothetical protein